jgi:hypothetical protein
VEGRQPEPGLHGLLQQGFDELGNERPCEALAMKYPEACCLSTIVAEAAPC